MNSFKCALASNSLHFQYNRDEEILFALMSTDFAIIYILQDNIGLIHMGAPSFIDLDMLGTTRSPEFCNLKECDGLQGDRRVVKYTGDKPFRTV